MELVLLLGQEQKQPCLSFKAQCIHLGRDFFGMDKAFPTVFKQIRLVFPMFSSRPSQGRWQFLGFPFLLSCPVEWSWKFSAVIKTSEEMMGCGSNPALSLEHSRGEGAWIVRTFFCVVTQSWLPCGKCWNNLLPWEELWGMREVGSSL